MSNIENKILDAVEIMTQNAVSNLKFDKTVRATIKSVVDKSTGKYQVKYQDSTFYAYADPETNYSNGSEVYVLIHSSKFEDDPTIVGTVNKIGTDYLSAVSEEDKLSMIGGNLFTSSDEVQLCSYIPSTQLVLYDKNKTDNIVEVNNNDIELYRDSAKVLRIAAKFRTTLPVEQQLGSGDYGLIVTCRYYNDAYKEHLEKDYTELNYYFNIDLMQGQPYKFSILTRQYALFPINGKNLKDIVSIKAFCVGFPVNKDNQSNDIFITDFECSLMDKLSEEELNGTSLRIETPDRPYFSAVGQQVELNAIVKIKGKRVNNDTNTIEYYWFIQDGSITSTSTNYISYAGEGWRCINTYNETTKNQRDVIPSTYKYTIDEDICPAKHNKIKCIAVFRTGEQQTVSGTLDLLNRSNPDISIISTMGAKFVFDLGKTTLKCIIDKKLGSDSYKYIWTRSVDGGPPIRVEAAAAATLPDIIIAGVYSSATYTVTVYNGDKYVGTASINLYNGEAEASYSLVLNNGTQVFKYNPQGISPTSNSTDPKDRITLLPLSFDIYNEQGQLVDMDDEQKLQICDVTWIWPTPYSDSALEEINSTGETDDSMLIVADVANNTFVKNSVNQPINNSNSSRIALKSAASLSYAIQNTYDIGRSNNNIKLEVNFKGQLLVASTNFTFTKDGELGTNGTKYVARIEPSTAGVERVIIQNNQITNVYPLYNGRRRFQTMNLGSRPLIVKVWGGSNVEENLGNTSIKWLLLKLGKDAQHNIIISEDAAIGSTGNFVEGNVDIIQAQIGSAKFSALAKQYFATYGMIEAKTVNEVNAYIEDGYDQVMYQSDGTISDFHSRPFKLVLYDKDFNPIALDNTKIKWYNSWQGRMKNKAGEVTDVGNEIFIEVPALYDSENIKNYIKCTYNDNEVIVYMSIHFYLNRYGLSAMNDWDGNSIQINEDEEYILAPQVGAGRKDDRNRFTGVTIGESFNANDKSKKIGLLGYYNGVQTIFMDSESGATYLGAEGKGQIQLIPSEDKAIIKSGNYKQGNKETGSGMQIDLTTPEIRFGTSNFVVNKDGHIHAAGGGDIAGWKIDDYQIYKNNLHLSTVHYKKDNIPVEGTAPCIYSNNHRAIEDTSKGFYLAEDGIAFGSKVKITADGIAYFGSGATRATENDTDTGAINTRHWIINGTSSNSFIAFNCNSFEASPKYKAGVNPIQQREQYITNKAKTNQVYIGTNGIRLGNKFAVDNDGNLFASDGTFTGNLYSSNGTIGGWTITSDALQSSNGKFTFKSNGSIKANNWSIDESGNAKFEGNSFYVGRRGEYLSYTTGDGLEISGTIYADEGEIGGWTINSEGLISGLASIKSDTGNINANIVNAYGGQINLGHAEYTSDGVGGIIATQDWVEDYVDSHSSDDEEDDDGSGGSSSSGSGDSSSDSDGGCYGPGC